MDSPSRKRSHSDMKSPLPNSKLIDEHVYCTTVLHLAPSLTEDDLDEQLQLESRTLGLPPPKVSDNIEGVTASLSATTIGSGSIKQDSLLSQSTAPTSCSSSEYRPMTQSSIRSGNSSQISQKPSTMSETQTKSSMGFRNGFRNKMAGLKRKKSPTSMSIASTIVVSPENDKVSLKSGMQSPGSAKSSKSSWSHSVSLAKSSYESPAPTDAEAMRRSTDCLEITSVQKLQMEERSRFLEFERGLLAELRTRRDSTKEEKCQGHSIISGEKQIKVDMAVEELEARQLEDELKMQKEHEAEKRTVMTRLRHMEAYCQNPTPPPTPVDAASGRPSLDVFPERKVTDKDYHSLAQQYRERDAMDTLHASKINVLRGKQKKAVENLIRKKEKEIEDLERNQAKELARIDLDFASQEANLRAALGVKRVRLESRWRTQALIERMKIERQTGFKHAPLPDVTAVPDASLVTPTAA